jgi:phosphoribosylaminoimidazolecarboxamide formyltransferase/IMP cyclohydrolase
MHTIKRALISVSDKSGIREFAEQLHKRGIEILSTGGTATLLRQHGIPVTSVQDVTGFPEIMDGRVKTLHPKIHGGLLAKLDNEAHVEQMKLHDISSIDLLVINLYPFEQTVARGDADFDEIIENIDIGGPAMLRAAAKNFEWTAVVIDPQDYSAVLEAMDTHAGGVPMDLRLRLAGDVFRHTAYYDAKISEYLGRHDTALPGVFTYAGAKVMDLRYGENPHQKAALYGSFTDAFRQLHGKELSYNNIIDIDAAQQLVMEFNEPTVVIIKHTNPCGVGTAATLSDAWDKAFSTDTVSPFGGIVAVNREVDVAFASTVHAIFTEVIIAPSFTPEALELLMKKRDRRLITADAQRIRAHAAPVVKSITGGFLVQSADAALIDSEKMTVATQREPRDQELSAMMYAWKVCKHVKSNAIVYAASDRTLAIGAGQMSRVDSARIAAFRARQFGISLADSAVASDAFFPFADGLLQCIEAGATAVIQPGGSVRDEEVVAAANEHNITMMFTGMRHFRH